MKLIRAAVRSRYSYLPLWYTLFYEQVWPMLLLPAPCSLLLFLTQEQTGVPTMRPLWYEFPADEGSWAREGSHMVREANANTNANANKNPNFLGQRLSAGCPSPD